MRERGHATIERAVAQYPKNRARWGAVDFGLAQRRRRAPALSIRAVAGGALSREEFLAGLTGAWLIFQGILFCGCFCGDVF